MASRCCVCHSHHHKQPPSHRLTWMVWGCLGSVCVKVMLQQNPPHRHTITTSGFLLTGVFDLSLSRRVKPPRLHRASWLPTVTCLCSRGCHRAPPVTPAATPSSAQTQPQRLPAVGAKSVAKESLRDAARSRKAGRTNKV